MEGRGELLFRNPCLWKAGILKLCSYLNLPLPPPLPPSPVQTDHSFHFIPPPPLPPDRVLCWWPFSAILGSSIHRYTLLLKCTILYYNKDYIELWKTALHLPALLRTSSYCMYLLFEISPDVPISLLKGSYMHSCNTYIYDCITLLHCMALHILHCSVLQSTAWLNYTVMHCTNST